MSINKMEQDYEEKRLEKVLEQIAVQLEEKTEGSQRARNEVVATQRSMWDEVNPTPNDLDDLANVWQYQVDIERLGNRYKFSDQQVRRLQKLFQAPYFGRIDFQESGENNSEQIYIGISTLMDDKTRVFLIYDWRAPVSSMFYDYETGKACYKCPSGSIDGDMLLKRQYKIVEGKIEYMFDSSLKIDDEILQEILSKSADSRMRTIVTTIQREQNRIIRDNSRKLLIVQGPAGSGKTSIALHRIAYLLYRYKDSITAENIVIFSPNQVFNDYISDVLPELGEENMRRTTFREFSLKALDSAFILEDMNDQMEYILSCRSCQDYQARIKGITLKSSLGFVRALKTYVNYLEREGIVFEDVVHNGITVISKEEITGLFRKDYAILPVIKRLEKIRSLILSLLEPYHKERAAQLEIELADTGEYVNAAEIKARSILVAREELKPIRNLVEKMTRLDICETYCRLFEDKEIFVKIWDETSLPDDFNETGIQTVEQIRSGKIRYEDVPPLLFLKALLGEMPVISSIKHVIIDEAQDYTPMQFEILKQLFKYSSITLLGDLNQSINSYMNVGSYETVAEIFATGSNMLMNLSKSYRSTREITAFSRALLGKTDESGYIDREGNRPEVIQVQDKKEIYDVIKEDIGKLKSRGYKSIAVICKTAQESRNVFGCIGEKAGASLITRDDEEYTIGTVIIPSYLAKGLEFDAVLVCGAGEQDYRYEDERKLLYTACTRALHQLNLYYGGMLSPFIDAVDRELYCLVRH